MACKSFKFNKSSICWNKKNTWFILYTPSPKVLCLYDCEKKKPVWKLICLMVGKLREGLISLKYSKITGVYTSNKPNGMVRRIKYVSDTALTLAFWTLPFPAILSLLFHSNLPTNFAFQNSLFHYNCSGNLNIEQSNNGTIWLTDYWKFVTQAIIQATYDQNKLVS